MVTGSISAAILPYDVEDYASNLRTDSRSGTTNLHVLTPYNSSGTTISRLHSFHKSTSGSMNLRYPEEWEGTIDGETLSGNINLKGKNLHVDVDGHYGEMVKHVVARRGKGNSMLDFRSSSGSVNLQVGD